MMVYKKKYIIVFSISLALVFLFVSVYFVRTKEELPFQEWVHHQPSFGFESELGGTNLERKSKSAWGETFDLKVECLICPKENVLTIGSNRGDIIEYDLDSQAAKRANLYAFVESDKEGQRILDEKELEKVPEDYLSVSQLRTYNDGYIVSSKSFAGSFEFSDKYIFEMICSDDNDEFINVLSDHSNNIYYENSETGLFKQNNEKRSSCYVLNLEYESLVSNEYKGMQNLWGRLFFFKNEMLMITFEKLYHLRNDLQKNSEKNVSIFIAKELKIKVPLKYMHREHWFFYHEPYYHGGFYSLDTPFGYSIGLYRQGFIIGESVKNLSFYPMEYLDGSKGIYPFKIYSFCHGEKNELYISFDSRTKAGKLAKMTFNLKKFPFQKDYEWNMVRESDVFQLCSMPSGKVFYANKGKIYRLLVNEEKDELVVDLNELRAKMQASGTWSKYIPKKGEK